MLLPRIWADLPTNSSVVSIPANTFGVVSALVERRQFAETRVWEEYPDRCFPDAQAITEWIDQPSLVPFLPNVDPPDRQSTLMVSALSTDARAPSDSVAASRVTEIVGILNPARTLCHLPLLPGRYRLPLSWTQYRP